MGSNLVFEQVMVLFLIMIVGMIATKRNIIDEQARKKMSELLLYITSPFLVVSSFNFKYSRDMLVNAGIVLAFALGIHLLAVFLGQFLFRRYPKEKQSVLKFTLVFSNCGFMGFPVLESLFGKIG
ncbi:MAG: AEC family transporter, partial [Clostridiales bacterium]|nr:AEC family transporter [Clostridiales bacterium]